jgi:nitrite reductase (NADH) small subunit
MLVLTFAASGKNNCVTVAGTPFIYARTELGSFVMRALCPHRGGPLHLARFEPGRARLICPWHERATSMSKALRSGIPAARRGNTVTAVFPHPADCPHGVEHRPVSPELSTSQGGAVHCRSTIPQP